jgi:hypothetical protein
MPQPSTGDVHISQPLGNISIAYLQKAENFIATKVFPVVGVAKQYDTYYKYTRADFNRDEARLRAPSTESAGGGYSLSTDTYNCKVYAFHKDIDDQDRANYDTVLDADRDATQFITHKMLIKREKLWVNTYFAGGVWANDYDGVASGAGTNEVIQWDDYTNGDPIADVDDAMTTILENTGFEPNTLVLGYRVFKKLKNHPDIIDRVKYTQNIGANETVKISAGALANLFFDGGQGRVFIMKSIENTAKEGATESSSFIGGKKALLCYSAPNPGIQQASAGYTFAWTGFMGASADSEGGRIKKLRMEPIESDRIEAQFAFDQKLVASDLGYFWDTIVS